MSKPFINNTSSVLGFHQWETFEFQMYAFSDSDPDDVEWTSSSLPPGLTLDATGLTAGRIHGAVTSPGVYVVAITATNVEGPSDPVIFTFGIEAAAGDPQANVIDLSVDIATREVTNYLNEAPASLFSIKYKDDLFLRVRFHRAQSPCSTLELTACKFAIKELETEAILASSAVGAFLTTAGTGVCMIYLSMNDPEVQQALYNYETEKATEFTAICELEWTATNSTGVPTSPATAIGSSKNFGCTIIRDINT